MNYLEIIGALLGLLYLLLEYKASIYLWYVGAIMPAVYIFVYYQAGLYADTGINIYYILAALYGRAVWKRTDNNQETPITRMPRNKLPLILTLIFLAAFLGIALLLIRCTDSTVPWLDSFTTALSIIGMWMLAQKYAEQWLVWIAVNIVSSGLYICKDLYFTSALYALYTVAAIFGYLKWIKMILPANNTPLQ